MTLTMHIGQGAGPINNLIIQGWVQHIKKEPVLSAYEELKIRNSGLMELTEQLKREQLKTERQIAEINELNKKLQDTNSYLEEFTYTVSHDLKTPLTTLNLSLKFLEETEDAESKVSYIQIIERAAKRLEKTVTGLVEILDVQTKQHRLAKKVDFEELFVDIKDAFAHLTDSMDVTFTTSFMASEIIYVAPYLTSIFTNLVSNSIKYRVEGLPLSISIATRRRGDAVVLTYSDNAEGIDLEKYGLKLFAPFSRVNTEKEGKGIGLYIIKKMIEKNGGKISLSSQLGEGSTFMIELKEYPLN